jgi:para-nitrobenzyl esterase
MRAVVVLLLALGLLTGSCRKAPEERVPEAGSKRTTPSGEVVGFVGRDGSHVWMGLPYAAPPTGDRRWRRAQPPEPWTGVREALRPGSPCVQYASPYGGIETAPVDQPVGAEDCLTVNVYAPPDATPESRLPVMVWIHGGGNTIGAGELYDGGTLAVAHDVIVVTVNYRLGPFGWFRHPALRAVGASAEESSGNFATLDLVRALEWVRDTIPAFGGDPDRITIFGESAGGTNVLTLLLAPQARGLFHRAVVQSAGSQPRDPASAEEFSDDARRTAREARGRLPVEHSSNDVLARLLVRDGRARDADEAKMRIAAMPAEEIAAYLRGKSALEILTQYTPIPGLGMIEMPAVFADGTVLPSGSAIESFARPEGWNRVPVILGTTRDESKLFMFGSPDWISWRFWILPQLRDAEGYDRSAEFLSKLTKADGADGIARAMVASGARDVFVYRFDWDEEPTVLGSDLGRMLGAAHGMDIPFVFGRFVFGDGSDNIFTAANEPGRLALSAAMMSYWSELAKSGRPGAEGEGAVPAWPAWEGNGRFLVLDTEAGGGIRPSEETVTREGLLAAVETDPRLADPRLRCIVYHDLVRWGEALERSDYDVKCPGHPFDGYPWHG